ncbi:hypothetical protein [Glutamicibacter sp.]|uniref:hypothetical protein n=1 Tax=Glutamicibacter sp. TaxID=1931995 RepID=UPI0028BE012E|nr:hypothetical protein [Glutamicibacter sp.]
MKRLVIPALGIGLALALQGCAAGSNSAEPTATVTVTASPTQQADNAETQNSAKDTAQDTPAQSVTTAYEESRRSVFTLDADQVSAFTGMDFESSDRAELISKLSEESRWKQQENTSKYSKLIAQAMDAESESAEDALREMSQDDRAKLRVYVSHNQNATLAHVGVTHDDK